MCKRSIRHSRIHFCIHLRLEVSGNGSLSPGQRVWPGSGVCGQKIEELLLEATNLGERVSVKRHKIKKKYKLETFFISLIVFLEF